VKNIRATVILGVAVVAGIIAMVMADRWLSERARDVGGAKVVVAARDIELGTQLTPQMLELVDWPKQSVPPGAANSIESLLEKPGQIAARVVRISVQKGEPVLENKLAPVGAKAGLAAIVTDGKRAMTVSVNEIVGVAGFALPGNYVDILLNTQDERSKDQDKRISKIVLEHVLVLAVAQTAKRDETTPRVVSAVTLEVTPEEAEKIDLARSVGSLTLVLRNQVDVKPVATEGVRKQALFGTAAPEPKVEEKVAEAPAPVARPRAKPAPKPSGDRVEVIRGVNRSTETFSPEGAK
jgi:pilus assembly protein CpaB